MERLSSDVHAPRWAGSPPVRRRAAPVREARVKGLNIKLVGTTQSLICVACGSFIDDRHRRTEWGVFNRRGEPQVGLHKSCVQLLREENES